MGIFICATTATGKSTLGKKYKNVIDMESVVFKYINEKGNDETRKSNLDRIPNPLYPQNYFDALESVKNKYDYILISDDVCMDYLIKNSYEYWQIFPAINLKDEYLKRCESRGNNKQFVKYFEQNWETWYYQCKNDIHAKKHIELQSNQFLEDVLPGLLKINSWLNTIIFSKEILWLK